MTERLSPEKFIGATPGGYHIERLIEQSKWGPIFLANSRGGTSYVMRFVSTSLQEDELTTDAHIVFLGRFQQEANQVATLQHPHILPLLDYGNYQGFPYLVYPHIPLTSLRRVLTQNELTDLRSVGLYLDQLASALEYAHQHAVIHRNLSTSCIYMQANRQLTVGEFGLMRMYELSKLNDPQANTSFNGSSESSSPEQLLGKPVNASTDIYAMGAVLYRLLTGHSPFSGKSRTEVTRQHLYAEVPSLAMWRDGLPSELDHIITKAMAKEPMQRYSQPIIFAQAYHQSITPHEPDALLVALPAVTSGKLQAFSQESALKSVKIKRQRVSVSRRRLIMLLAAGGVAAASALMVSGAKVLHKSSALNGVATLRIVKTQFVTATAGKSKSGGAGDVLALSANVPINSAKTFPIAHQNNPGIIIHLPNNKFVAFDTTCTHARCSVKYDAEDSLLKCPCHGAIFNPAQNAEVVQGPAKTPLAPIKITVHADGTITT